MKVIARDQIGKLFAVALVLLTEGVCFAQDSSRRRSSTTVQTTTTQHTEWYITPWAWIAGGVLVILLLAAIFSGSRSPSSRTTVTDTGTTRTITTDTDKV